MPLLPPSRWAIGSRARIGTRRARSLVAGRRGQLDARCAILESLEERRLLSITPFDQQPAFMAAALPVETTLAGWAPQHNTESSAIKDADGRAIATAVPARAGELLYTGQWLATLASDVGAAGTSGQAIAAALARQPNVVDVRSATVRGSALLVDFSSDTSLSRAAATLSAVAGIEAFAPIFAQQQSTRLVPNDPLFGDQWHLQNTGQSGGTPGADAKVVSVWDTILGSGVVIGIVDDGLEYTHPDLSAQYLASASFDFNDNDADPAPSAGDDHGTPVAGIAAAVGNNAIGVSGAAPQASLAALRLIADPTVDSQEANALSYASQVIDIYSNSWGPFDDGEQLAGPGPLTLAALASGVTNGRGGLGSIYVWAAGNGLTEGDNVNYDGYANSRYTIAVSAIDHNGVQSSYSEPGAAILVAAYSSNGAGTGITTTALGGGYTSSFGGTSAATPLASGVIALVLEANPNLTYRDVQHILVETAAQNDPTDADWTTNGAGHLVNHKYGFGAIDAAAAVAAAQTWSTVGPEQSYVSPQTSVGQTIPDNNTTGLTSTINVPDDITVEWVEVVLNATHPYRGDLRVVLTSPDGTQSVLAEEHGDPNDNYSNWTLTSARHWGESSAGLWSLKVTDEAAADVGTWNHWTLRIHGTATISGPAAPRVLSSSPAGTVTGPVSSILVNFNEAMDQASFALADDVASFTGPGGDLLPAISGATWLDADTLEIAFTAQTAAGAYSLVLAPSILDANDGLALDQNQNGTPGESVDDQYTVAFTIDPGDVAQIHGSVWDDLDGDGVWDGDESGLEGWNVFLDLNENGAYDEVTADFSSTDVPKPIPDVSTITSTLDVDGILGTVTDVNVTLTITHTFDADLEVFLIGPTGAEVELFTDVGGSGQNFSGTTLDDEALLSITAGSAPFSGSYQPEGSLALFDGLDPHGTWTLRVTDDANIDVGTLVGWSITISYLEPSTTTDENGAYYFAGLPAETYVVAELLENGWIQTYPEPAGGGGEGGGSSAGGTSGKSNSPGGAGQASTSVREPDPALLPLTTTASAEPIFVAGELISSSDTLGPAPRTSVSSPLINLPAFRADPRFAGIDGSGFATVIIDTGIDLNHSFFGPDGDSNNVADRIVYSWDFADNDSNASDVDGHGSNVASIVASEDATFGGMAPGVDIIALKVFKNSGGSGSFGDVEEALQWVVANAATYNIASVNMSLGDSGNYGSSTSLFGLGDELAALASMNVIVSSSAGNGFFTKGSVTGVSYPAADPNSLAVGAVWDSNLGGPFNFSSGAKDFTTGPDRITSFSQRHPTLVDIFAPGAMITGAGTTGGTTTYAGTSQASPHIAGIAALAQQLAVQELGRRITLAEFRALLASTGVTINDGDDEDDNVTNTGLDFRRVNVLALGEAILALDGSSGGGGGPSAGLGTHTVTLAPAEIAVDVDFGNMLGNQPPEPDAGGPYSILEGESLVLDASATTDPDPDDELTYSWDVNGDGVYGDATGVNPTLTWSELVALGIADGPGEWDISVRVDDGAAHTEDSPTVTLTLGNAPPTADAGGPYAIVEGESLFLVAAGSDPAGAADPLMYLWDLDGNGFFGEVIGQSVEVTWAELVALGLDDGPNAVTIQVQVQDGDGGVTDSALVALAIGNAPPTAGMVGPQVVRAGVSESFTLSATDPGLADQAAPFTYEIDWDADGTFDETFDAASVHNLGHTFAAGSWNVGVRVTDRDGAPSAIVSQLVHVYRLEQIGGDLEWEGSGGADVVEFEETAPDTVEVRTLMVGGLALVATESFVGITGTVKAWGRAGADEIDASSLATIAARLEGGRHGDTLVGGDGDDTIRGDQDGGASGDGAEGSDSITGGGGHDLLYGDGLDGVEGGADTITGGDGNDTIFGDAGDGVEGRADSILGNAGDDEIFAHTGHDWVDGGADNDLIFGGADGAEANDTLIGGTGNDILSGATGNDSLDGGAGRDLLFAGAGSDRLNGLDDDDLLVADSTSWDLNAAALLAIHDEWSSTAEYADRIDHITGAVGGGLNGAFTLVAGITAFDDNAADTLAGGAALDWFLYDFFDDLVEDEEPGETLTDLGA